MANGTTTTGSGKGAAGPRRSPAKGRPTPRRGERQERRRRQRISATTQWIILAVLLVVALVLGGIAWGGSDSDGTRRVNPIGGHR